MQVLDEIFILQAYINKENLYDYSLFANPQLPLPVLFFNCN